MTFRTLAAAYAEAGRFSDAMKAAEAGRDLASRHGNSGLVYDFDTNLLLYRAGQPLRDPSLKNSGAD